MQIAKAAADSGSWAQGAASASAPRLGNPAAYSSIAAASIRTERARSATQAQAARTSSGSETEGMTKPEIQVRRAGVEDAADIARLLHDFNVEYSEPTPEVEELAETIGRLLEEGEITVLLAGDGPDGLSLFRFRPG